MLYPQLEEAANPSSQSANLLSSSFFSVETKCELKEELQTRPSPLPAANVAQLHFYPGEQAQAVTANASFAPPPLFPPNREQKVTSDRVVFKLLQDAAPTGPMAQGTQHISAGLVPTDASLSSMKHLTSVPQAALVLSLIFASFHLACSAGRTVSFILGHPGKGEGGRKGRRE